MGENETTEVKAPAAPQAAAAEKPVVKTEATKDKKKEKRTVAKPDAAPHLTGRLLQVEISTKGVEFAVKGKKGKAEVFSLKGMDAAAVPAAAAMLANLLGSKTKLRVEYTMSGDARTVSKISAHN
jgi:chromatin remodeling complex protein RSC6